MSCTVFRNTHFLTTSFLSSSQAREYQDLQEPFEFAPSSYLDVLELSTTVEHSSDAQISKHRPECLLTWSQANKNGDRAQLSNSGYRWPLLVVMYHISVVLSQVGFLPAACQPSRRHFGDIPHTNPSLRKYISDTLQKRVSSSAWSCEFSFVVSID